MKPRRSKPRWEDESPLDEDEPREDRPRRARRPARAPGKRRKLLVLLVVAAIAIGLLPMIVAKTPLRNVLLAAALPTDAVRISADDATLGWFSTPSLANVRVFDAAGDTLAVVESIRIDRAPGNLLVDSRHLGLIEIVRPSIYLKIRGDGNNLEDTLRQALAEVAQEVNVAVAPAAPSQPVEFAVQVVDGTIFAEDATTGRRWRVQALDVLYDTRGANGGLGRGQLSAQIADIAADNSIIGSPGQFNVALQSDGGKQQLTLQANAVSLGLADAWLRQRVTGSEVGGMFSGEGSAQWTASGAAFPSDLTTSGSLAIDGLDATAPALAGDRIRLARVEVPWRLAAQPEGLKIEALELRSDVAQLAARGTIDRAAFTEAAAHGVAVADAVAKHEVELRGSLDLVRLVAMLPHALKIRNDTKLTSGSVQLAVRSQPADGGQLFTGSLQTSQLAATSAGRPFRWDQPMNANFAVRRQQGTLRLDTLTCDSDFLKIDANGTPQQMTANAQFDLNRLAEQLGKFIDLSGIALAGTGAARVEWKQTAPSQFSGAVTGEVAQLRISLDPWAVSSVQSTLTAELLIAGDTVHIRSGKLVVTDSRAASPGWNIQEPHAELSGDLHWNRATGEISAGAAQLVSSAVSVATKDVRYRAGQPVAGQPSVGQFTGMAAFRGDVARLAAWRAGAQQPPAYQPSGELSGNARFMQQGDRITGEVVVTGQNVALAQLATASPGAPPAGPGNSGYQTIWQEPQISIRGLAAYESASDRLAFEKFQIQSNSLQAAAAGQIERLSTAADIKVNGTLNYDLAQITPLLAPYLGSGIQLTGREQAQFALAGELKESQEPSVESRELVALVSRPSTLDRAHWSRRVQGKLEVPWAGANAYGLPIGAGRLTAALANGVIHVEPLSLAVGEGQLTAAPNIRLDPEPSELTLPQGPLITNVRISPEVSEALLKFVAPVLAGATQSDGQFSLALDGARVPLRQSKKADAAGQLTVHSVRVVPGPLAKQWVELAQQIESLIKRRDATAQSARPPVTLLSVKDQQVIFRVVEGRVHHQNMEFQVGDVTLRSQGSVGLDETVALTLSVPIQEAWIAKEPLLSGFKGQSLQIPISGTLTRPKMDERAIASITQQLLQGAAQQAIGGELNKALDKLFKPR